MAEDKTKVTGLAGANTIMRMILEAGNCGAAWESDPRDDKKTNRAIIDYLAEGNRKSSEQVRRDIRPTEEDANDVAKLFIDEIAKKMRIAGKLDASGTPVSREKAARQAAVSAMRKAAKKTAKIMYDRVRKMKTNDGSNAHPVGKKYAAQRARKHGVSESVVFIASTQLANALQKGKVKIYFKKANIGGLLQAVNRAKL